MDTQLSLVRGAIVRPDEPRHFMVLKPLAHLTVAMRDGMELARSRNALRMHEAGYDLYDPTVYFPRCDVDMSRLRASAKVKTCPLKGTNQYYDLVTEAGVIEDAAWSFETVVDFDPRIAEIHRRIAFASSGVHVVEYKVLQAAG